MNMENYMIHYKMEELFEWRKWLQEIPYIKFAPEWEVKIIPPFGGAVARFKVKFNDKEISIYLDCYDKLGCVGKPYWEIYPAKDGDTDRFLIEDTEGLINGIRESLMESPTTLTPKD